MISSWLNAQQRGDFDGGSIDLCLGGRACLVVRVGVADAAALHGTELLQHPRIHRGVCRIIQIDHNIPLEIQINSIGYIIVRTGAYFKMSGQKAEGNCGKRIASGHGFWYTL